MAQDDGTDFSPQQLADLVGVHVRTVLNWLHAGTVKAYRLPGHKGMWRIPFAEVERIRSTPVEG